MIDVVEPWEVYSCGRYRKDASRAIGAIAGEGKIPIVVGGSGLYVRAVSEGLFEGPERDEPVREKLRDFAARMGREALHARLIAADPDCAGRIHPRDTQRVIRALEVFELTGRPMSELQRALSRGSAYELWMVALVRERAALYEMINRRLDVMLERGFVEEVRNLTSRGFSEKWPSFRTVGYREIAGYLGGLVSLDAARENAKTQTRRFAKRQMTWLAGSPVQAWIEVPEGEAPENTADRLTEVFYAAGVVSKTT
ncbi:MAG: tRNA (adenosine(37)-N6)-dimethylallyltransferase MiaA, partial [Candidatus Eisenbacteria bacterium]